MLAKVIDKIYTKTLNRLVWESGNGEARGEFGPFVAEQKPFADVLNFSAGPLRAQMVSFQYGCWCGHISIFGVRFQVEIGE